MRWSFVDAEMDLYPLPVFKFHRQQRLAMDYMFISAVSVFIYDYFLTLRLEIKLIWFSPWSYTKVLFLVFRYTSFILMFLFFHNQIFPNLSVETCKLTYAMEVWLIVLQATLAEIILSLRTWAIWNRNRKVGVLLAGLILVSLVPQCILLSAFSHGNRYLPHVSPHSQGCFIWIGGTILSGNYATLTTVEAIFLALITISALLSYREGNIGKFSFIIHRDGILFYVYLLCVSIANIIVAIAFLRSDIMFLLVPLESTMYSVFTTRIILNIRDIGNRTLQTELHTIYEESHPELTPARFALDDSELPQDCSGLPQLSLQESQGGGDDIDTSVQP